MRVLKRSALAASLLSFWACSQDWDADADGGATGDAQSTQQDAASSSDPQPRPQDAGSAQDMDGSLGSGDASEFPDDGSLPTQPDATLLPSECTASTCKNGGTCAATLDKCECAVGFRGATCETSVCAPNPCANGGACTPVATGASCKCKAGFRGDLCEIDIDECAATPSPCTHPQFPCAQTTAPGFVCRGQLADWPMPGASNVVKSYDLASNDIVTDRVTGLVWQRQIPADYPSCRQSGAAAVRTCTWQQASTYCADLTLGGFSDWRLPSVIEAESIFDYLRNAPSIDTVAFPNTPLGSYWTSSDYESDTSAAWVAIFTNGGVIQSGKTTANNLRCVRGGTYAAGVPSQRYTRDEAAKTILDTRTGLTWTLEMSPTRLDWNAARAYCTGLSGNFRLPKIQELQTLMDPMFINPSINWDVFTNARGTEPVVPPATVGDAILLWSETIFNNSNTNAWAVLARNGTVANPAVTNKFRAYCVK